MLSDKLIRVSAFVLSTGIAVWAPGCAAEYYDEARVVEISTGPPPPRYEVVPAPPYVGAVWIGGYWGWRGRAHVWVPGRYVRPRPGYVYVPHNWARVGPRWRYHPGGWRRY